MGKAFSEEEREQVQERLRRVGLTLLAKRGIRSVSIRELTREVGIAQGGFYTFYKDKEDFVLDLMCLRVQEKTQLLYERREDTLKDPRGFLVTLFFNEGMHLKENKAFQNGESQTLEFWERMTKAEGTRIHETYIAFLDQMITFWQENGYEVTCDRQGLMNVGKAAGILFTNASLIGDPYFEQIYKAFCETEIDLYFKAVK